MRRLVALAALLVTPLLVVGCSSGSDSDSSESRKVPAIRANSAEFSTGEVEDELRFLIENPRLVEFYKGEELNLVPKPDHIDADTAAFWVNQMTQSTFIDAEFARRNLKIDPEGRAAAAEKVSQIFGGPKVFAKFPREFRELVIQRQLRLEALQTALGPRTPPTEAELQELYARVQQACPSGLMLSQTWSSTKAKAEKIASEVAAGTDFATVAQQRSEDEDTKGRGGRATCLGAPQYNQLDVSIREAAESLPPNGTSEPIRGNDGYFVLNVSPMTYEGMLPLVEIEFYRKQLSPLARFLTDEMKVADPLVVAPRFGKVARQTNAVAIVPADKPVDLSD